jgi:outer membrane protein TolC
MNMALAEMNQPLAEMTESLLHEKTYPMLDHRIKPHLKTPTLLKTPSLWAVFLFVLIGPPTFAQNGTLSLSLKQARLAAVENNRQIKTADLDVEIAEKQIWETTAGGLPQVSASVGYQYSFELPTSLIPAEFFGGQPGEFTEIQFGTEQNLTASATINQMIFSGEYIVGLRAARIYRELASQNRNRTTLEVKTMVTETYLLALLAYENLEVVSKTLENMRQTLFETRKILEAGFTDPVNVDQLQLTVKNLEYQVSSLKRQEALALSLLRFQAGLPADLAIELTDTLDELLQAISLDASLNTGFNPDTHIDLRIMQSQEAFSTMVLRREQSFFLPRISAFYTRQEMAMRDGFNFLESGHPWFPSSYFGINLDIPIFSSGMRSARVKQARIELEKARIGKEETRQALLVQMEQTRADFETAMEQYLNQKENLELARRILERTTTMHREGLASSLELTQASDQLLSTQSNYLGAMAGLLNAQNSLEKALGRTNNIEE